ncbi:hypothetical protein [Tengunoibacter tsumagoiensis]|uniref:Uncharacterized protein n=1 Tax=Tengunoibacter tsumagoiensis TaxID=2014871 RepID=A0A401ZW86_9CHLR|nr:hypothetical protein [Tengunoibacter tsumagoiensis]GCE11066.1 hypothetical protein KTT_09250 [Tengunoibacter tsumagoiensis]
MNPQSFLLDDMMVDDLADAELDELFGQLTQFEAPVTLVNTIMDTVSHLPRYNQKPAFYLEDYQQLPTSMDLSSLC